MLFSYSSVIPFCYSSHCDVEWFSCWLNYTTVCKGHWFRECAGHDSCCGCPITRTEFNWMHLYSSIRGIGKERFQVLVVLLDTRCLATIRPYNLDISTMNFIKKCKVLIAECIKVQCIKSVKIGLYYCFLVLWSGNIKLTI